MGEDKKYSFTNNTIRLYNPKLLKVLRETFKKTENQFANSKNEFLTRIIERGTEIVVKELSGEEIKPELMDNKELNTKLETLNAKIDLLMEFVKNEVSSIRKENQDLTDIAIVTLASLLDMGSDYQNFDVDDILTGKFGNLPKCFLKRV